MICLPRTVLGAIEAEAVAAAPAECCGLLTGHQTEDGGIAVTGHVASANLSPTPRCSFEIAPQLWLDAARTGDLIGLYHSHPGGDARPSSADARAAWPITETNPVLWLILGLPDGEPPTPAAFLWSPDDGAFTDAPLRRLDSPLPSV